MRVLHVITDRDRRGAQVFGLDLAEGLSDLGVTNTVVALAPGVHDDLLPVEALGARARSPRTLRQLRRLAQAHDVVIAHGSSTLLACAVALVGSKVPFVYRQISDPAFWASSWPKRLRVAALVRRAAAIVAVSDSAATLVRQHYRLRQEAIVVIPNAVPHHPFAPATTVMVAQARRAFSLPEVGAIALYVGALSAEKGVELAIEAVGRIPTVHLLIVGGGPEMANLVERAAQVAPEQVTFTGPLERPVEAMHAADLLVLPSRSDSMPAVLIEAGLCGLPAVSTAVGAIPEVVLDGTTGLIVPVSDIESLSIAIRHLAEDESARTTMGHAARQRCLGDFTMAATAPRWEGLLARVAACPKLP